MLLNVHKPLLLGSVFLLTLPFTGCSTRSVPTTAEAQAIVAEQRQEANLTREQMEQIPPPSKTQYLAVKSLTVWQNPYMTVQGGMVTLHVTLADANPSQLGVGGMLRPTGARRQELNVRVEDLPTAMNAIPRDSWPYGRVIAVEEAHGVPASARPEVRRNMERVIKTLSDLDIVVYEWTDTSRS